MGVNIKSRIKMHVCQKSFLSIFQVVFVLLKVVAGFQNDLLINNRSLLYTRKNWYFATTIKESINYVKGVACPKFSLRLTFGIFILQLQIIRQLINALSKSKVSIHDMFRGLGLPCCTILSDFLRKYIHWMCLGLLFHQE